MPDTLDLHKLKDMLNGKSNKPGEDGQKWRNTVRSTFEESRQTLGLSKIMMDTSTATKKDHIYKKKYSDMDFSLLHFIPKVKTK